MKLVQAAGIAAIALAPFAAHADQGDMYLEHQLVASTSMLTRADVRMQITTPTPGQQHPVELRHDAASKLSRADVLHELMAAMRPAGGA